MCKNVIIILTTAKPHTAEIADSLLSFFQTKGIQVDMYRYEGFISADPVQKKYDFAVTLGGDGTVLFAARYCAHKKIPIFPISLGEFGFIAGIEPEHWKQALEDYLAENARIHERLMLSAAVYRGEQCAGSFEALNDIVISGGGIAKLINLAVSFNGVSFGTYRADGVIASSPTGSTAYSAASGGPIMDPTVSAFVLTPISAFSLSNRPIVLPASGVMNIEVLHNRQKNIIVSIDGQELFPLCERDRIEIRMSPHRLKLIGVSPEAFYSALRSKLAWSGSSLQE